MADKIRLDGKAKGRESEGIQGPRGVGGRKGGAKRTKERDDTADEENKQNRAGQAHSGIGIDSVHTDSPGKQSWR